MSFDIDTLLKDMIEAAKTALGNDWDAVRGPMEVELEGIAAQAYRIKLKLESGALDPDNADIYEQLLRNRTQSLGVLLIGLTSLTIQNVINAIMGVLQKALSGLLDFT